MNPDLNTDPSPAGLYKTTLVIWSLEAPKDLSSPKISQIFGSRSLIAAQETQYVVDPGNDPHWVQTTLFEDLGL
jgi:hypothetical protein